MMTLYTVRVSLINNLDWTPEDPESFQNKERRWWPTIKVFSLVTSSAQPTLWLQPFRCHTLYRTNNICPISRTRFNVRAYFDTKMLRMPFHDHDCDWRNMVRNPVCCYRLNGWLTLTLHKEKVELQMRTPSRSPYTSIFYLTYFLLT